MNSLQQIFTQEASDILDRLDDLLLDCENAPDNRDLITTFLRELHTLKGTSATAGHNDLSELAHTMEDVVQAIAKGITDPVPALFDAMAAGLTMIRRMVFSPQSVTTESLQAVEQELSNWTERQVALPAPTQMRKETDSVAYAFGEYDEIKMKALTRKGNRFFTVDFNIADIDSPESDVLSEIVTNIRYAGEMVITSPQMWEEKELREASILHVLVASKDEPDTMCDALAEHGCTPVAVRLFVEQAQSAVAQESIRLKLGAEKTLRVNMDNLDALLRYAGELVSLEARFIDISEKLRSNLNDEECAAGISDAAGALGSLASDLQRSVLFARMIPCSRIFRILKRVVRNAGRHVGCHVDFAVAGDALEVDKGVVDFLVAPFSNFMEELVRYGENGVDAVDTPYIALSATSAGGQIVFTVSSSVEPTGSSIETLEAKIRSIGGRFELTNDADGTELHFVVPTTLAIVPVMLFTVGGETYGINLDDIMETMRFSEMQVETIGGAPMAEFRGRPMVLVDMRRFLGAPKNKGNDQFALVIRGGKKPLAILVDELVGNRDIVIKPLAKRISNIHILHGATVLGDGNPALLLNALAIIENVENNTIYDFNWGKKTEPGNEHRGEVL